MAGQRYPNFVATKINVAIVDHETGEARGDPSNYFDISIRAAIAASLREAGHDADHDDVAVSYWDWDEDAQSWAKLTILQTYTQVKNAKTGAVKLRIKAKPAHVSLRETLEHLRRAVRGSLIFFARPLQHYYLA
jgi:hypothetical protein